MVHVLFCNVTARFSCTVLLVWFRRKRMLTRPMGPGPPWASGPPAPKTPANQGRTMNTLTDPIIKRKLWYEFCSRKTSAPEKSPDKSSRYAKVGQLSPKIVKFPTISEISCFPHTYLQWWWYRGFSFLDRGRVLLIVVGSPSLRAHRAETSVDGLPRAHRSSPGESARLTQWF